MSVTPQGAAAPDRGSPSAQRSLDFSTGPVTPRTQDTLLRTLGVNAANRPAEEVLKEVSLRLQLLSSIGGKALESARDSKGANTSGIAQGIRDSKSAESPATKEKPKATVETAPQQDKNQGAPTLNFNGLSDELLQYLPPHQRELLATLRAQPPPSEKILAAEPSGNAPPGCSHTGHPSDGAQSNAKGVGQAGMVNPPNAYPNMEVLPHANAAPVAPPQYPADLKPGDVFVEKQMETGQVNVVKPHWIYPPQSSYPSQTTHAGWQGSYAGSMNNAYNQAMPPPAAVPSHPAQQAPFYPPPGPPPLSPRSFQQPGYQNQQQYQQQQHPPSAGYQAPSHPHYGNMQPGYGNRGNGHGAQSPTVYRQPYHADGHRPTYDDIQHSSILRESVRYGRGVEGGRGKEGRYYSSRSDDAENYLDDERFQSYKAAHTMSFRNERPPAHNRALDDRFMNQFPLHTNQHKLDSSRHQWSGKQPSHPNDSWAMSEPDYPWARHASEIEDHAANVLATTQSNRLREYRQKINEIRKVRQSIEGSISDVKRRYDQNQWRAR